MRATALMNGGLIGFGLGFIAASIALNRVVSEYLPQYASTWQFRGVAAVGGLGLIFGIAFELYERNRLKKQAQSQDDGAAKE